MSRFTWLIGEVHRRSLWQVLAIYLGASWLVFEIVQTVTEGLGLPQWFPSFAALLLLIGLPIVLGTAFVQEGGPVLGRRDPTLIPDSGEVTGGVPARPVGARRLLTWRNAITGGALAFGFWGLGVTGWVLLNRDAAPAPDRKIVAVLPFENLGAAEDEYFADGITEEITARLASIHGLGVIARTSAILYKGSEKTIQQIGGELEADYVLEGTVRWAHEAGGLSRVRVTPQLIKVMDATHLWANVYEKNLDDIFQIQTDIAQNVVEALDVTLLEPERQAIRQSPTDDLEAYDRFLRGNYLLAQRNAGSLRRAIEEYDAALEVDPRFTEALARIALTYALYAIWGWDHPDLTWEDLAERGLSAAERAVASDSTNSDAWLALGHLRSLRHPRSYEGVTEALERAIALNPRNAEAHHQYAWMLFTLGRKSEALSEYDRTLAIDPARVITLADLGYVLVTWHDFEAALQWEDSALSLDPTFAYAYYGRARAQLSLDRISEATSDARQALRFSREDSVFARVALALTSLRSGDSTAARGWAEAALDEARRSGDFAHKPFEVVPVASAFAKLGEHERAFQILEQIRPRGALLWSQLGAAEFDALREFPRFQRLVVESKPRPVGE